MYTKINILSNVSRVGFHLIMLNVMRPFINKLPASASKSRQLHSMRSLASLERDKGSTVLVPKRSFMDAVSTKGLHKIFAEGFKHFSPLNGLIFRELAALNYLYDTSEETASALLVKELFYRQGEQFKETQNKSKAGYSLSDSLIAEIIHHLHAGSLDEPTTRSKICDLWKKKHKLEAGAISTARINAVLTLISNSQKECKTIYPAQMTEHILLAFLCYKANKRPDLLNYLDTLFKMNPEAINGAIADNNDTEFNTADLCEGSQYLNNLAMRNAVLNNAYYEETVATLLIANNLPNVIQASYGYNKNPKVPNCVETAFQNLFNILVYDGEKFNFKILPANLKPHEKLIAFYDLQAYKPTKVNDPRIGQAFMDMISDLEGIRYSQGNYEIVATLKNFIPLLNYFFGSTAQSLEELSKQFSNQKRQIRFDGQNNCIEITLFYPGRDEVKLTYKVSRNEGHAELITPKLFHNTAVHNLKMVLPANDPLLSALMFKKTQSSYPVIEMVKTNPSLKDLNALVLYFSPRNQKELYELFELLFLNRTLSGVDAILCELMKKNSLDSYINNSSEETAKKHLAEMLKMDIFINKLSGPLLYSMFRLNMEDNQTIDKLLTKNPDLNQTYGDYQSTLLHQAVSKGNLEIATQLLQKKANPNIQDRDGKTCFHCPELSREMTELLLQHGADPCIKDLSQKTPLHYGQDEYVTQLLLMRGVDPNAQDDTGNTILHKPNIPFKIAKMVLEYNGKPGIKNNQNDVSLHYVQSAEVVRLFLTHEADPSAKNRAGKTPLDRALADQNNSVIELLLQAILLKEGISMDNDCAKAVYHLLKHDRLTMQIAMILLNRKPDLNMTCDGAQETCLHLAVSKNKLNFVRLFLEHGANPNIRNYEGKAALYFCHDAEIMQLLFEKGIDPLAKDNYNQTALYYYNDVNTLRFLLEKGIDPNSQDKSGNTALHETWGSTPAKARLLLEYGANPNIRNNAGKTALHSSHKTEIVQLLVEKGLDPLAKDNDNKTALYYYNDINILNLLLEKGINPNSQDNFGNTVLHHTYTMTPAKAKLLLEYGADPNIRNNDGKTALHIRHDTAVSELFFEKIANPLAKDSFNRTALYYCDDVNILRSLLEKKVDPNSRDIFGNTVLHETYTMTPAKAKLLLEYGADPNIRNNDGKTALHIRHDRAVFKLFFEKIADTLDKDRFDRTILYYCNDVNILRFLLEKGLDPNSRDTFGETALHTYQSYEKTKLLLEFGANPNLKNHHGKTPLDYALDKDVKKLLLKRIEELKNQEELRKQTLQKNNMPTHNGRFRMFDPKVNSGNNEASENHIGKSLLSMFVVSMFAVGIYTSNVTVEVKNRKTSSRNSKL
jgi:ankyrin repeat protein